MSRLHRHRQPNGMMRTTTVARAQTMIGMMTIGRNSRGAHQTMPGALTIGTTLKIHGGALAILGHQIHRRSKRTALKTPRTPALEKRRKLPPNRSRRPKRPIHPLVRCPPRSRCKRRCARFAPEVFTPRGHAVKPNLWRHCWRCKRWRCVAHRLAAKSA